MRPVNPRDWLQAVLFWVLVTVVEGVFAASDDAIETMVVTGTKAVRGEFGEKSGIPLDQLPQSVQVLEPDDLLGVRSMGDALRFVPSANAGTPRISAYQSFSLRVRGFLADQMRNGVRQRYYEDVDASAFSNVERIEVLKGPSSVLFGQSAVGGLISVVTKQPSRDWLGALNLTLGSDEERRAGFDVGGPIVSDQALYFRLTGELERSGTYIKQQDLDRNNLGLSLSYQASDSLSAHFVSEWIERETEHNAGLPIIGTVISNDLARIDNDVFLGEPFDSHLDAAAPLIQAWVDYAVADGWTITPRVSYSGFNTDFTQIRLRDAEEDGVTVNRNGRIGKEDDEYLIWQLDVRTDFEFAQVTHHLLAGLEYDRERSKFDQFTLTNVGPINSLNPQYQFNAMAPPESTFAFHLVGNIDGWALYLQDLIDVTPAWNVVLGVRASQFETFTAFDDAQDDSSVDDWVYQLGTTWRINTLWSAFAGYNTGFDVELSAGGRASSGRPFDPERSDQLEVGIRIQDDNLSGTLAVFQVRRRDVLTTDPLDPDFQVQKGELRVRGIEFEGVWRPYEVMEVRGGYAWIDSEITQSNDGDEGEDIGDTPRHNATFMVRWSPDFAPLSLWTNASYVGKRTLVNGSKVELDAYAVVGLGASTQWRDISVDIALTNLLDEDYYLASGNAFAVFPGDPRQISLTLGVKLQ